MGRKVRYSHADITRRRHWVKVYLEQGYTQEAIGLALSIDRRVVGDDKRTMGIAARRGGWRYDTPPTRVWWSDLPPQRRTGPGRERPLQPVETLADIPKWRRSRVLSMVALFTEAFREEDFANVFGWHVTGALGDNDTGWLAEADTTLVVAHEQLGRLLRVLRDPAYRAQCTNTEEGRESLRSGLRVVE